MKTSSELLRLINLKQIDKLTFEGSSVTVGSANVFGGQVLAQALNAAYRTVPEDRFCHSLHCYFLLPGDLEKPIRYRVQQVRNGGSFTTRYVIAEQNSTPIFVMAASFQIDEEGYEFQEEMPEVAAPETVLSLEEIYERMKEFLPERLSRYLSRERPVTFKPTILPNPMQPADLPPHQNVWFRFNDVEGDISLQNFHELLSYASDYNLLTTALNPHASVAHPGNTMVASIDHSMWIHRKPENFADWFLFSIQVRSTSNARGFVTGKIFSRNGKLIASVGQEGLMRKMRK